MATTSDHRLRYQLQYSKSAGRYVVKKIMAPKDYSFRTEILEGITSRCTSGPKLRRMLQVATATKEVTLGEHAGVIKQQTRFAVSTTIQPKASKLIRLISSDMEI